MKILLATYYSVPYAGGISTYINELARGLKRAGHKVDVFAHYPHKKKYYMTNHKLSLDKPEIYAEIRKEVREFYRQNMPQADHWMLLRDIERYCFETVVASLRLEKYDLIHTQDTLSTRALWRLKPARTPLVATLHGCNATEKLIFGKIASRDSIAWNYAVAEEYYGAVSSDITIVASQWLKNILIDNFHVPAEHITVIPYGIDIDEFKKRMTKPSDITPPPNKKILACPARLAPVKGHKHLLHALAMLKQERNDWICWIIGDGRLRKKIQHQSNRLGLDRHVLFLGSRNDVPVLLKHADAIVLPSLQDNSPFSVIEAQIAGKPVIVSDAGGIPEIVQHKKTGLISPAGQSEALYRNLEKILVNSALRKRLAVNAKSWGEKRWPIENMMQQMLAVYQTLLKPRS